MGKSHSKRINLSQPSQSQTPSFLPHVKISCVFKTQSCTLPFAVFSLARRKLSLWLAWRYLNFPFSKDLFLWWDYFTKKKKNVLILCVCECFACICGSALPACLVTSEDRTGIGYLELGLQMDCVSPCRCWEPNPSPLKRSNCRAISPAPCWGFI